MGYQTLVSGMNNALQESQPDRIKRFKDAIRQKLRCGGMYIGDQRCNLVPFATAVGSVSVFNLPIPPPDKNQASKQCFVWNSEDFRAGGNEEVVVLDVQVLDDSENLSLMAVWSWLSNSLVNDTLDEYVESKIWSRDKLLAMHKSHVEFDSNRQAGSFFVRPRADGKCSVRVCWEVDYELNGKKDFIRDSFALDLAAL